MDACISYLKPHTQCQAFHTYLLSSYQVVVALSFLAGPWDLHDPLAYQVAYLSHKQFLVSIHTQYILTCSLKLLIWCRVCSCIPCHNLQASCNTVLRTIRLGRMLCWKNYNEMLQFQCLLKISLVVLEGKRQAMHVQHNNKVHLPNNSEYVSVFLPHLSGMQSAREVSYCHLWPVCLYHIFPHYLT